MPRKGKLRRETSKLLILELGDLLAFGEGFGHRLAVELSELRLGIERLEVRGTSSHVKEDHAFGPGRMMERIHSTGRARRRRNGASQEPRIQQARQGHQAKAGTTEKGAAIQRELW